MSHNLALAQSNAFALARTLMVPVTLFEVDGEYGVMPSDELDDVDILVVYEYDPYPVGPACCLGKRAPPDGPSSCADRGAQTQAERERREENERMGNPLPHARPARQG